MEGSFIGNKCYFYNNRQLVLMGEHATKNMYYLNIKFKKWRNVCKCSLTTYFRLAPTTEPCRFSKHSKNVHFESRKWSQYENYWGRRTDLSWLCYGRDVTLAFGKPLHRRKQVTLLNESIPTSVDQCPPPIVWRFTIFCYIQGWI